MPFKIPQKDRRKPIVVIVTCLGCGEKFEHIDHSGSVALAAINAPDGCPACPDPHGYDQEWQHEN